MSVVISVYLQFWQTCFQVVYEVIDLAFVAGLGIDADCIPGGDKSFLKLEFKQSTCNVGLIAAGLMCLVIPVDDFPLWAQAAAEKGQRLTCKDIKDIIKHACDTDEFTEAKPERFGDGKINAYKGLLYVLGIDTKIPTLSKDQPKDVNFRVAGDIVYTDGAEDGIEVTVYNLQGVAVRQTTVQGGAISLEGLQKGVYAVQLGKLGSTLIRK